MVLKITSFKSESKVSEQYTAENIPYIAINITWRVESDKSLLNLFKTNSEDYGQAYALENPEEDLFNFEWKRVWVAREPLWMYLEKFDTFWLRDCIADCAVTRAALADLHFYFRKGRLPTVYRHAEEYVVFRHLETLTRYWD